MADTYTLTVDGHPLEVNINLQLQAWDYMPPAGGVPVGYQDTYTDIAPNPK